MTKKLIIIGILLLVSVPAFAQSVDTAWVRRYNGPDSTIDQAYAITVDVSGNVYVTGFSRGSETYEDYATLKYYPNGDVAWARRYNGSGNSWDYAKSIAVDGTGNVYITGYSQGSGTQNDYATIKYYPNGDTAWVRRYNGPGNEWDIGESITIDDSSNVYVTGRSYSGTETGHDYTTIKYLPHGDTAWIRRYNGPANNSDGATALVVDDSGNVYVTGYSWDNGTDFDYATVKRFPNGDTAWARRYNGPGNSSDWAYDIAVDDSGNVYVTGYSFGDGTSKDFLTIKYLSSGDSAWVRRYNLPGDYDEEAHAIVVDDSGNVYVTGWSLSDGSYRDYLTIKYYPDGDTAWVRRYFGSGDFGDEAHAIAIDDSGNVYVTGESNFNGTEDYATIKYDPSGTELWVKRYNGPANQWDEAYDIALYGCENVYVTGYSWDDLTNDDYFTIKYVQFLRGDVNNDEEVTISDVVYLISYLFRSGPDPLPAPVVGDANCDDKVDIIDAVYLVNYLFKSGPAPGDPDDDGIPDC